MHESCIRVAVRVLHSCAQCLQASLLSFSINIPTFQYFACIFSIFQYFTKASIYDVCAWFSQFPVFLKFYQYLWSEFSKNTDKSVYLEALCAFIIICDPPHQNQPYCTGYQSEIQAYLVAQGGNYYFSLAMAVSTVPAPVLKILALRVPAN